MAVTNNYKRIALSDIKIKRDERQRRGEINVDDLIESVRTRGVLSPILVHHEPDGSYTLVFGERRYTASVKCGLTTIPARISNELDPVELQIIELEENLRRKDLPWQDHVHAVAKIHSLWQQQNPDHSQVETAKRLDYTPANISTILRVHKDLGDEKIAQAPGLAAAYNMLYRKDERAMADLQSDILDAATRIVPSMNPGAVPQPRPLSRPPEPVSHVKSSHEDVLNENFLAWAPNYKGQPFNFIHCDFPYGINFNAGPQSGARKWNTYNDSPDIYWALVTCLCENLDRLMAPSAHMMFWLSADVEVMWNTLECFRKHAPSLEFQGKPLVWHKSDNVGILSDPKRGTRHVYETCLMASREDRFIIRAVSDTYSAPTDKQHHQSTKPEPVLRHFMQMFVDENTMLLDPTCGGGSALRAAESLGAKRVLGLEIDPENCAAARSVLRQFRTLRAATKK